LYFESLGDHGVAIVLVRDPRRVLRAEQLILVGRFQDDGLGDLYDPIKGVEIDEPRHNFFDEFLVEI